MIEQEDRGWFARLKAGLDKSSKKISDGFSELFVKKRLDINLLEDIEDILIQADLGISTSLKLRKVLEKAKFNQEITPDEVKAILAQEITKMLEPVSQPLDINTNNKPHVILVCGVNGSGKTTTIGKLAKQFSESGKVTVLVAADTFRAAASEQLQIWGERAGCEVVTGSAGADPSGLAFDALQNAKVQGVDVLMVDTAGRLQNRDDLMSELQKIVRVLRKIDASAPHDIMLVMDATVGQNAHSQVEVFKNTVDISGLVITKLDGSAKGGVVVALATKFGINIHAVGVGERITDLQSFEPSSFANSLLGLKV